MKETAVLFEAEDVVHVTYESYHERGKIQIAHGVFDRNTYNS